MTKTKLSMMTAVLAGAAVIGALSPALAGPVVRPGGNVVHPQVYDSAGKAVNRLPARVLGGTPHKTLCRNYLGVNRCDRI